MSWGYRASLTGNREWQFSNEIASPIIRVRWTIAPTLFYKGLIARVRTDDNGLPQFYNIKRIWSNPSQQVLDFSLSDDSLENSQVAFKVLNGVPSQWNIDIDGWSSPTVESRLLDVTQDMLVNDKIIINHNLSSDYTSVSVWDSTRNLISPHNIRTVDNQSIELDFQGLTPLIGIYKILVKP